MSERREKKKGRKSLGYPKKTSVRGDVRAERGRDRWHVYIKAGEGNRRRWVEGERGKKELRSSQKRSVREDVRAG